MELLFLGVNDVGMEVYEWLCEREDVDVTALLTTREQLEQVKRIEPDIIVSVGYDHLVPADILSIPPEGCVNLHPALLPHNRGKSPNVWSIVDGTPAGVTLHYMAEEFDTGEIIAQREVATDFADSGRALHERLERAQFDLFTDVWPDIETGDVESTPQPPDDGCYHSVDEFRELCEIDPDESYRAKDLIDVLRALTFPPFDNAYMELNGDKYYIEVDIRHEGDCTDAKSDGFLSSY